MEQTEHTGTRAAHDATRQMAERYRLAVRGSNDLLWDYEPASGSLFVSDRLAGRLGYSPQSFRTAFESPFDLMRAEDAARLTQAVAEHVESRSERFLLEIGVRTIAGDHRRFLLSGAASILPSGSVLRLAGSLTDLAERHLLEMELRRLASIDELTALPNRQSLLEEAEARSLAGAWMHGIVLVNLDHFRWINETYGHAFGDSMLQKIAQRLSEGLSHHDVTLLARVGGDEFAFILGLESDREDVATLAEWARQAVAEAQLLDGRNYGITASTSCALYPDDGDSLAELLKNAGLAMDEAKRCGRNRCRFYDRPMGQRVVHLRRLETSMRDALEKGEFKVYYQPIMSLDKSDVQGFEALLRWFSPEHGNVPPDEFIPIAERSGMILPISEWLLDQVCGFAASLGERVRHVCFSINTSVQQWIQPDFEDQLQRAVQRAGIPSRAIGIELTENMLAESVDLVAERMSRLKYRGFRMLLDDFGTGYSSLSYLRRLPFDTVKVDRAFVQGLDRDGMERRLMGSIISLTEAIDMKIVAEGVETDVQREWLAGCKCAMIQGYLVGRPMPADEVPRWLSKRLPLS